MDHRFRAFLVICFILLGSVTYAQQDSVFTSPKHPAKAVDSVKASKHSPTTAMLLSIIPGGGQIYNKKYWKLPIVYGLIGTSSYFIYYCAKQKNLYRDEYIARHTEELADKVNPQLAHLNDENILALKNKHRRNMEIAIGVTAILYALNIVDAMVDAHFYDFDISDDLSLRIAPEMLSPSVANSKPAYGITLNFKF